MLRFGAKISVPRRGYSMAENEAKEEPKDGAEESKKPGRLARIAKPIRAFMTKVLTPKVMLGAVLASFVVHGALYWYYSTLPDPRSKEVALGEFEYVAYSPDGSLEDRPLVEKASFELHVNLVENAESRARELLVLRERRIRQGIEELIRQARDREFADPELVELKRRLVDEINHTLGIKAVDEVLITELRLSVVVPQQADFAETAAPAEPNTATIAEN